MIRIAIFFTLCFTACGNDVVCKELSDECANELEMYTCIDESEQIWYEFSDGKQIACSVSDCVIAADEAVAYCNGLQWDPPQDGT